MEYKQDSMICHNPSTTSLIAKKIAMIAPLGYGRINNDIFRSSYPANMTHDFIKFLRLKTMICLQPNDVKQDLREFVEKEGIELCCLDIGINQEPFVTMNSGLISQALTILQDPQRLPALVFCTTGKIRTSCVVGCFRKLHRWSLVSIFHEMEQFAEPEGGQADLLFVENFQW